MPPAGGEHAPSGGDARARRPRARRPIRRSASCWTRSSRGRPSEDPDSDDARLVRWTRRDYEKAVRVPAELAAEMTRARRSASSAPGRRRARRNDYAPLPRRARRARSSCATGTWSASRASSTPTTSCSTTSSPASRPPSCAPLFAELRDALVPLMAAAGDPEQARNDGACTARSRRGPAHRGPRRCSRPLGFDPRLAARPDVAAPVRRRHRPERRPPHDHATTTSDFAVAFYSALHEFGHGLYERRSTRSCSGRRSTTRSRSASTSRRAACGRTSSAAPGRSASGCSPRLRERLPGALDGLDAAALYRAVNTRPAVAHPHRGRRDDLQPAHHRCASSSSWR